LIQDVQNERADFDVVLVYDVSRWGRFQDADESAYYEYICRRGGVKVDYCAEQFENDGSGISNVVKTIKRVMAGEYSRELSAKVFIGQCRLIELGFRQGGPPGFGLRRMLRDASGRNKGLLNRREQKSIQTDRVVLVSGPPEEVEIVRWIYRTFVEDKTVESKLAAMLNQRSILTDLGRPWTRGAIHQVLTNEKYIGNNVYNRSSFKLKKKRVVNPPEMWIRKNSAFEPIVPSDLFVKAQFIISERSRRFTNEELLAQLRSVLDREGRLSGLLIDETEGIASSSIYRTRFGSLIRAYQLIGYVKAMFAVTQPDMLLEPEKHKAVQGLTPEQIARMEQEMEALHRDLKAIEESHGEDVLNLVLARGYLEKLFDNTRVSRYLTQHHSDLFRELQTVSQGASLEN
jgi:DNA invertase Pin-like site-specific DNA recombinase